MVWTLAAALASFPVPVAGQGAAGAVREGAGVDTSKPVAVDTAKSARMAADTSTKAATVDTAKSTRAAVDTSKAVAVDTAKSPRTAVDAPKAAVVDTAKSTRMAADTSTATVVVDTSKAVGVDTAKSPRMAVDTATAAVVVDVVDAPKPPTADTAKSTGMIADTSKTVAVDTAKPPRAAAGAPKSTSASPIADKSKSTSTMADTPKPKSKVFAYTFHILFFAISVTVIALTVRFFLTRRDSRRFLTTTRLSVLDKTVQRGCRYIESNYGDLRLTPVKVCKAIVTGQSYLDALFMNELGINVHDFIVQVRVNAIKNALASARQEALDVPELCVRCGFKDRAEAEAQFARICGGVGIAEYGRSLRR